MDDLELLLLPYVQQCGSVRVRRGAFGFTRKINHFLYRDGVHVGREKKSVMYVCSLRLASSLFWASSPLADVPTLVCRRASSVVAKTEESSVDFSLDTQPGSLCRMHSEGERGKVVWGLVRAFA